jgi:hypothetical protein
VRLTFVRLLVDEYGECFRVRDPDGNLIELNQPIPMAT